MGDIRKHYSKEIRAQALKRWANGEAADAIAKECGIGFSTLCTWAARAGLSRRPHKAKRARRVKTPDVIAHRKLRLEGGMRTIGSLVTEPGLSDKQRVDMIAAYLNLR